MNESTSPADTEVSCALYRYYRADGVLLYVGVSLFPLVRMAQHRDASPWFSQVARVDIEKLPSRQAALAAERAAIKAEKPLHNVTHLRKTKRAEDLIREHHHRSQRALEGDLVTFKPVYTLTEVANVTGLSRWYIRRAVDAGELGAFEVANRAGTKTKEYVTGWQLIDWLQWLQHTGRSKRARPRRER